MTVTNDMLSAAYERYREASREVTLLSLVALAQRARASFPNVESIELEWSDQGPFLSVSGLLDVEGGNLDEDGMFDTDTLDWNLTEDSEGYWGPYMVDADGNGVGRRTQRLYLDVDRALAIKIIPGPHVKAIHYRDPDMECVVEFYVDGVLVTNYYLEDIDPGRGYDWDGGWKDQLIAARADAAAHPDDAFRAAVYQGKLDATESVHVGGKPDDWREQITNG